MTAEGKTMNRTAARGLLLTLMFSCCAVNAQDSLVFGPVESIARASGQVTILGQTIQFSSGTEMPLVSSSEILSGEHQLLIVAARAKNGRLVALNWSHANARYVAGASQVVVQGVVDSLSIDRAELLVGGLKVYYGDIVSPSASSLTVGDRIVVAGVQPVAGGALWAAKLDRLDISDTREATAVLAQSIRQRAAFSTVGAEAQSITGTGRQRAAGTGKLSITGTGIQSITGTGALSITGTGALSITGTGIHSITGTGTNSITGTGRASITGTGTLSITGTGLRSITGTGAASQ